jgi:hypothetical protein
VAFQLKKLKQSLKVRGDTKFIPQKAKMLFNELEETGNSNAMEFTGEVDFYATCTSYIEMWEGNFEEVESFSWVNQNDVKLPEVHTAAELVNIKVGQSSINIDQLLDEVCWLRRFIIQQTRDWERETISCEGNWIRTFKHFSEESIPLPNLMKAAEFVCSLRGTSALVEHVFSFLNKV